MFTKPIAARLKEIWPEYKIYTEEVRQYLQSPCFVILPLQTTHEAKLDAAREFVCSYAVYFYSDETKYLQETLNQMGQDLYFVLDEIPYQNLIYRGDGMQHKIVDHALLFEVSYVYRGRTIEEFALMETMQYSLTIGDE